MSEYEEVQGQSQETKLVFDFKKMHDDIIELKKREAVVDNTQQSDGDHMNEIRTKIVEMLSKVQELDGLITEISFFDYSLEQVFMKLVANDA